VLGFPPYRFKRHTSLSQTRAIIANETLLVHAEQVASDRLYQVGLSLGANVIANPARDVPRNIQGMSLEFGGLLWRLNIVAEISTDASISHGGARCERDIRP